MVGLPHVTGKRGNGKGKVSGYLYGFGNEIGKFGNDFGIGNVKGIKKEIYFEAWE